VIATLLNIASLALSKPVQHYIHTQRDRLKSCSTSIPDLDKARLSLYFSDDDLRRARIVLSDPLPIPEPPLVGVIRRFGFDFPGIAGTAAITFDNVIACREHPSASLLFHELVHTVQYRRLGVPAFARQYVRGFLATKRYRDIPLERCAFDLQVNFETQAAPFSAEWAIAKWLQQEISEGRS
jgi:hypothetical protein